MSLSDLLPFRKLQRMSMSRWRSPSKADPSHHRRARAVRSVIEGLESRCLLSATVVTDTTTLNATATFLNNNLSADAITDLTNHGLTTGSNFRFTDFNETLSVAQFNQGVGQVLTQVKIEGNIAMLQDLNFTVINTDSTSLSYTATANGTLTLAGPAGTLNLSAATSINSGLVVVPADAAEHTTTLHSLDGQGTTYTDANSPVSTITLTAADGALFNSFIGLGTIDFAVAGTATSSINFQAAGNHLEDGGIISVGRADVKVTYIYGTPQAKITISPDAVNAVGDAHTFTTNVQVNDGLSASEGGDGADGFVNATVGNVDVTLTNSNGAAAVLDAANSTSDDNQPSGDNINASGNTTTTFTSNSAGIVTGHASAAVTVLGVALTVETDGVGANSDDAVKRFVDAYITIGPDATNPVGAPHTFTTTVFQDDGLTAAQGGDGVTGFTAATVGNVDVTLTNSNGANAVLDAANSTSDDNQPNGDNLNGSGQATTTFTSATAGTVTGHATVSLVVSGITLTRQTNGVGLNSVDAVKVFQAPQIVLKKFANGVDTDCVDVSVGDTVKYTYTVTNGAGAGPSIDFDSLVDDNATPAVPGDDFNPIFDGGDTNPNGLIDDGETWLFHFDVTAIVGEHHNLAVVNGHAVIGGNNVNVSDDDDACYEAAPGGLGGTATMGFWANKNGQSVIKSDANIGNDLAAAYSNLFGAGAAAFNLNGTAKFMNLTGQSASNVAAYFTLLKDTTGPKPYAQLMANALAAHFNTEVTSQADKFGFGDGDLLDDAITLTSGQAAALGLPVNTTVGAYLTRVNTIMAGKNGIIPSNLFIIINDVSDKINNMNHV